ncbi:hypothetical protein ACFW89_36530 [Streptomyces albidoflavus]
MTHNLQTLAYRGADIAPTWLLIAIVSAVVVMMIVLRLRRRKNGTSRADDS